MVDSSFDFDTDLSVSSPQRHSRHTTPVASRHSSPFSSYRGTPSRTIRSSPYCTPTTPFAADDDRSWQGELSWHLEPTGWRDGRTSLGAALSPWTGSEATAAATPGESRVFRRGSASDYYLSRTTGGFRSFTKPYYEYSGYGGGTNRGRLELRSFAESEYESSVFGMSYTSGDHGNPKSHRIHGDLEVIAEGSDVKTIHRGMQEHAGRRERSRSHGNMQVGDNDSIGDVDDHDGHHNNHRRRHHHRDHGMPSDEFENRHQGHELGHRDRTHARRLGDKSGYELQHLRRGHRDKHVEWESVIHRSTSETGHKNIHIVPAEDEEEDVLTEDDDHDDIDNEELVKPVGLLSLFRYSTKWDMFLIILGCLGALVNCGSLPWYSYLFGNFVNKIGRESEKDKDQMMKDVREICVIMTGLSAIVVVGAYLQITCWRLVGKRAAQRMRTKYLQAVLRQDIGFFDTEVRTGDIMHGISSDVAQIQEVMGEKSNFIQYIFTFVCGYIVGFMRSWKISLVVLSVTPLTMFCGIAYKAVYVGLATNEEVSYLRAGSVAEQAIRSIRTVLSFVAEDELAERYGELLEKLVPLGMKIGFAKGAGMGVIYFVTYSTWALALWYASLLVDRGQLSGGPASHCLYILLEYILKTAYDFELE